MSSNIEPIVLDGHNYVVSAPHMKILLKRKVLWQYTTIVIPYLTDTVVKFVIGGKKDEAIGVITTYISREICFHTSRIDGPHEFWNKLKVMFDKVVESHVTRIEKELISLDPHSFERIEYYLARIKEL